MTFSLIDGATAFFLRGRELERGSCLLERGPSGEGLVKRRVSAALRSTVAVGQRPARGFTATGSGTAADYAEVWRG